MPFRPYPGSEADLLYGKSVKQSWLNGLYRFVALYSGEKDETFQEIWTEETVTMNMTVWWLIKSCLLVKKANHMSLFTLESAYILKVP